MVLMGTLADQHAEVGVQRIQKQEGRIPPGGVHLVVGRLAHFPRAVGGMVGDVEPQGDGLADPQGGVGDEKALPSEEMVGRKHLEACHGEGPRVENS